MFIAFFDLLGFVALAGMVYFLWPILKNLRKMLTEIVEYIESIR